MKNSYPKVDSAVMSNGHPVFKFLICMLGIGDICDLVMQKKVSGDGIDRG